MPNIQNQKKRAITNAKRAAANTSQRTALRTQMKNVLKLVEANDKENAIVALNELNSRLDQSVTSGIQHKNFASRQKARFAKLVQQLG